MDVKNVNLVPPGTLVEYHHKVAGKTYFLIITGVSSWPSADSDEPRYNVYWLNTEKDELWRKTIQHYMLSYETDTYYWKRVT